MDKNCRPWPVCERFQLGNCKRWISMPDRGLKSELRQIWESVSWAAPSYGEWTRMSRQIIAMILTCVPWTVKWNSKKTGNVKVSFIWFRKKLFSFTDTVLKSQIPIPKFQLISKSEKPISETYRSVYYDLLNSPPACSGVLHWYVAMNLTVLNFEFSTYLLKSHHVCVGFMS